MHGQELLFFFEQRFDLLEKEGEKRKIKLVKGKRICNR